MCHAAGATVRMLTAHNNLRNLLLPRLVMHVVRAGHVEKAAATLTEGTETDPPCRFDMETGTVMVFDYRLVHRGTANKTGVTAAPSGNSDEEQRAKKVKLSTAVGDRPADTAGPATGASAAAAAGAAGRPLLYFVYSKPWWIDERNFKTHENLFTGRGGKGNDGT